MAWWAARRWERRPTDPDFLVLRAGVGTVPLDRPVRLRADAGDPLTVYDPVCLAAAQELVAQYSVLPDQPICLRLDSAPRCRSWAGPRGCGPSTGRCWPN